jgi:hypothetical protein
LPELSGGCPRRERPIGRFQHVVRRVTLMRTGEEVAFEQTGPRVLFKGLPAESPDRIAHDNILKLEYDPVDTGRPS